MFSKKDKEELFDMLPALTIGILPIWLMTWKLDFGYAIFYSIAYLLGYSFGRDDGVKWQKRKGSNN